MKSAIGKIIWKHLLFALALGAMLCTGAAFAEDYPESEHPYVENSDISWSYTHGEEAYALEITFSEDTCFESGFDFLYVTDSEGTVQKFTGTTLQGKSAVVMGSSFTLRLTSDGSGNHYGFAIAEIKAFTQEEYEEAITTPRYTINSYGVITAYSGLVADLVVPAEIDGVAVKAIGSSAFSGNTALKSIVLPEGLTQINGYAFQNCTSLTGVQVPDSLMSIGWYAFSGCTSLTALELPEGLESIANCAFYKCSKLASVNIPSTVTSLGGWAFASCSALTSAVIPEGVMEIGDYTFYACHSLASLTLHAGVTSIGQSALAGTAIEELVLPDGVTFLGSEVFWDYYYPGRLYCNVGTATAAALMEGGWKFIDPDHPDYWIRLLEGESGDVTVEIAGYLGDETALIVPSEIEEMPVTGIGSSAFAHQEEMTSIVLPDSVVSIGEQAFCYCSSLNEIVIPENVTIIGNNAFSQCKSLTKAELPDGVVSIGDYAFSNCTSLLRLELPDGLESIGVCAFEQNIILVFGSSELIETYANDNLLQYICDGKDVSYSAIDTVDEMVEWAVATYTTPDMSEFDRALRLYDWLCARARYDYEAAYGSGEWSGTYSPYSAAGALLGGWSVCDGFADAYMLLLEEAGMESVLATGDNHEWTFGKIDGKWYQFDATWDEGGDGSYHEYFALTDEVMMMDHEEYKPYTNSHTICDSWEANYYYHTGALDPALESFREQINESISAGIYSGTLDATADDIRNLHTNARNTLAYILERDTEWSVPGRVEINPDQNYYARYSFQFYPDEIVVTDIQIEGYAEEPWSGYYLYPGYSVQMNVTTEPAGVAVNYASSDESVFTVSDTGLVTALSEGYADLIVSAGNYRMEIRIFCRNLDDLYIYFSGERDVDIGETVQLNLYGTRPFLADYDTVWSSSDESVATITQSGLITAMSYGKTTITVSTAFGLTDSYDLCVRVPATAAYMDKAVYEGKLDDDYYITWWIEGCDQDTYNQNYGGILNSRQSESLLGHYVGTFGRSAVWNEEAGRWEYTNRFWGCSIGAGIMQIWPSDDSDSTPASAVVIVHSKSPMTLPAATREIHAEAFAGLAMDEVVLPEGVRNIGARAFADCASLKLINLPDSVETIAEDAFNGSDDVTIVCSEGSAAHAFAEANDVDYVLLG